MGEEPLLRVILEVCEDEVNGERAGGDDGGEDEPRGVRMAPDESDEQHNVEGDEEAEEMDPEEQLLHGSLPGGRAVFLNEVMQRKQRSGREEHEDEPREGNESEQVR